MFQITYLIPTYNTHKRGDKMSEESKTNQVEETNATNPSTDASKNNDIHIAGSKKLILKRML